MRARHTHAISRAGCTTNQANDGILVNVDDVTAPGLFVARFQH